MKKNMKNTWKIIIVFSILSVFGCNYPTPKMACKEDLEVYSEGCVGTLLMYQDSASEAMLNISTLLCAQYINKKEECNRALY